METGALPSSYGAPGVGEGTDVQKKKKSIVIGVRSKFRVLCCDRNKAVVSCVWARGREGLSEEEREEVGEAGGC